MALTCGYALWVQFRGPLASHGSPWQVSEFHNYLYAFVTPSGALLFHTTSSAAAAASYPEPRPEYLAYLGWPLLVVAVVAAVRFWRDPKVRLAAVTFALLELLSLGAASVTVLGIRYPAALLPWHWLQGLPVLADALPDRLSILADGAVAALLAFALDRARGPARITSPSGSRIAGEPGDRRGTPPLRSWSWPSSRWCPCRYRPPTSARPRPAGSRPSPGYGWPPAPRCWSSLI